MPHRFAKLWIAAIRVRSPSAAHTPQTLAALQADVDDFMERFGRLVAPVFASCGRTIKLHKFAHHMVHSIERLGSLQDQSASDFESNFSVTKAHFQ